MLRILSCLMALAMFAPMTWAQTGESYNEELGLPHWAPGRGVVDHDAVRRRSLEVLERQFSVFRTATGALTQATLAYCDNGAPRADLDVAFRAAWLAWAPLDSYQFGPIEARAAALTVNFWPDKKGFVGRAVRDLLAGSPEAQRDPETVAAGSAAAQGFPAIELLLASDAPECPAIIGIAGHLDLTAQALFGDWFSADGWADLARAAGPGNPVYQSDEEFTKTLYTALDFGLIRIAEQRLGRPLGSFERSFPKRAEAWRSGLSEAIIAAQLDGISEMIEFGFAGDIREPDRAWVLKVIDQAQARLDKIAPSIPEAVTDPVTRFRVEALQTKVRAILDVMAQDIGPNLGVDTGFSPADGD